jgi:hypothetical protein
METVTYPLRVETGSDIVIMMVGSRWRPSHTLRVETGSNMVSMMVGRKWRLTHTY